MRKNRAHQLEDQGHRQEEDSILLLEDTRDHQGLLQEGIDLEHHREIETAIDVLELQAEKGETIEEDLGVLEVVIEIITGMIIENMIEDEIKK